MNDGSISSAGNFRTRFQKHLVSLPSVHVVEEIPLRFPWLRRQISPVAISVKRCDSPQLEWFDSDIPLVIAWTLHVENYLERLESIWTLHQRPGSTLQLAFLGPGDWQIPKTDLREAGVLWIQQDWFPSPVLERLVTRFWLQNSCRPRHAADEVLKRLPLTVKRNQPSRTT